MNTSPILLVTGGLGFIGKHFVKRALERGCFVVNVDVVGYAADRTMKAELEAFKNYRLIESDIRKLNYLPESDFIVNFAAESHVDNAITSDLKTCETNFMGVQNLLSLTRLKQVNERPVFIQISTDEVYGDNINGLHTETAPLNPSNPYSATKAAADLFIQSFGRTHSLNWRILRPSNNYGHHQFPEKLIPKSARRMKRGLPALMHGDGSYMRSWLHVEDTVAALFKVIEEGRNNEIYNASGVDELKNIEVLRLIAKHLNMPESEAFVMIEDRAGQDVRYGIDSTKMRAMGWQPTRKIRDELPRIVDTLEFDRFL